MTRLGIGYNKYHFRDNASRKKWGGIIKSVRWDVMALYQKDFAKLLGVDQQHLSRIENCKTAVTIDVLQRLLTVIKDLGEKEVIAARERGDFRAPKGRCEPVGNFEESKSGESLSLKATREVVEAKETVPEMKPCMVCNGDGRLEGIIQGKPAYQECTMCKGYGYIVVGQMRHECKKTIQKHDFIKYVTTRTHPHSELF